MVRQLLVVVFLSFVLAGCAANRKNAPMDDLHMRVNDMEKKVQQKDEEIQNLKDEVAELNDQLKRANVRTPGKTNVVTSDDKDVVRVSAAAKDVQKALAGAGYYNGPVDGKIGDKTKKAIKTFQQANGLNPDGVIGQRTWLKLKTYLN